MLLSAIFFERDGYAQSIAGLTIKGAYAPAVVGTLPVTSTYSWITTTLYTGGQFSWMYGPGTNGGVVFGRPQAYGTSHGAGEMSSWFLMLTRDSWLYSTRAGISIDSNNTIDMSNLALFWSGSTVDLGVNGVNPLVPLVPDIALLAPGDNGWMINTDGSYHLIYYNSTVGACGVGCATAIHLYGSVQSVPLPGTSSLLGSGLVLLLRSRKVRNKKSAEIGRLRATITEASSA